MNNFKKSIAILFAISFVFSVVTAILLFNFDRHAFTAETYQQAFAREDFYNKIPSFLAQSITSGGDPAQQPLGMQGLSQETWEGFFRALLPPEILKPIGDDVLASTFAYINLATDSIQVNLGPVKASMLGDTGTQAALVLVQSLPPCTIDQAALIMFGMFSGDQVQLCNPPENVLPMLMPLIQGQMQVAASLVPDQLTLFTAPSENDPRQRLQTIRFMMRLSPLLPIFFLLALTVLCVRTLNDWLKWWGIPTLVAGLLTFIMGLLGAPVIGSVITSILSNRMPTYLPEFLSGLTGDLASAMVRALMLPIIWQGLILSLIGAGLTAGWYLLRRRENSKA